MGNRKAVAELSSWGELAAAHPDLARFGQERFTACPAYIATVRASGAPRVHPCTPIIGGGHLFVFMEPTSPKGRDLRHRGWYAIHSGVPDNSGTGGEFFVSGRGALVEDPQLRALAADSASYAPAERYVLFDLAVDEARCHGYGDVVLPEPGRWPSGPSAR